MNITEDDSVIEEVLNGNVNAFGLIVKKYQRPIFNLMLRVVGSEDKAADLAQETFIRAYEKLDLFRPGNKFFSWLYAIGMNLARDSIRKKKIFYVLDEDRDAGLSDRVDEKKVNPYEERIEMVHLHFALKQLPLKEKEAIILRFREGLSMKEISVALEISVSGAKMRVHRGLKKLRDLLSEEER
ncbi:MAG: sigma-70 family RNA polymerase sigma factor [Deltaproteobacteria bacterium]|nr:sigma-70 family RNA polymerase sigma factor [Deltaproteobacteria bacterium]